MKAVIELDVPEWQIGRDVTVYFPDTMVKHCKCELLKEHEAVEPYSMNAERTYGICPECGKIIFRYGNVEENHYCGVCGQEVKWE